VRYCTNFQNLKIMNIQEIKAIIGAENGFTFGSMPMTQQFDTVKDSKGNETEVPNDWASYWNNDVRVRVTAHKDILAKLAAEPNFAALAVKKELLPATADRAAYTRYVIITPRDVLVTL
jgi:hypothetical protein